MKNPLPTIFFSAAMLISAVDASAPANAETSTQTSAQTSAQENTQANIDIKMPLVPERQYFSYKGHNSSTVTLETLQQFDAQVVMDMYDESPVEALNDIGLIILVHKALQGVDVQTMTTAQREGLVSAEMMKKLRQMGRTREAMEFGGENAKQISVVPSIAALCEVLEDYKSAILRQQGQLD
jgi:hypothetical protein